MRYWRHISRLTFGSPLLALKLVAGNSTFAKKVDTVFIEADDYLYVPLQTAVTDFANNNPHVRRPITDHCTFANGVRRQLDRSKGRLPPTFLFVDPCGVSGTSFDVIKRVMSFKSSEAFVFFNIDGVRRIAGLPRVSEVLVELLGSENRAKQLFQSLQATTNVADRERMILEGYREALREDMDVKFTIPFRVESEDHRKTSHYLIHATNHRLGFKIMKEIMWTRGASEEGEGALQFSQASRTNYFPMFDPRQNVKDEIRSAMTKGPQPVNLFYHDLVYRPDDMLCQPAYKQALLEMEQSGEIEVLDKDGHTPKPLAKRPRPKGKPTLGEGYFVRLRP